MSDASTIALGELVSLHMGQAPSSKDCNFDGKGTPFVKAGEFGAIRPVIREWTTKPLRLGQRGDVFICVVGATCGKINLGEDCAIGRSVAAIRPNPSKLNQWFLYYFLMTLVERLRAGSMGAAQTVISKEMIEAVQIPRLPLPEQRRIVGVLDEAFAGIATAKANAEKNLRNAWALIGSVLEYAFMARDDTWTDHGKPLAELCELIVDCEHKTAPTQDEGIPSIRTPNIGKGQLLLDGVYRVSKETYREWTRRAEPRAGDLILAREAPAGNVAVIPDGLRVCLGQRTVLIRPKATIFDSKFLAFELLRPEMQQRLLAHSRGATVQHVNMRDIRALRIGAIPTLALQRAIVKRIEQGSRDCDRLAALYQQKLAALDALKRSLLHQAFSGQLASRAPVSLPIPSSRATLLPSLTRFPGLPPDMLHAGVLALSYKLHEHRGNLNDFGHVAAEKTVQMVESHLGYDTGRDAVKEAAGPLDFDKRRWVDTQAKSRRWFKFEQTDSGRYIFEPLEKFNYILSHTRMSLGPKLAELETLLRWMARMDTKQSEIVATVYAGWNNLLLDGRRPTDEEIVYESRENWHEAKLMIERWRFFKAIDWLRKEGVVPSGKGKRIVAKGEAHAG